MAGNITKKLEVTDRSLSHLNTVATLPCKMNKS